MTSTEPIVGRMASLVRRDIERRLLRARNGIKYVAGIDQPGVGLTPKDTVWRRHKAQLWRYRSDHVTQPIPVVLVFSLITRSYVFDLRPGMSFVEYLRDLGYDVYLLDWGVPDASDAGNLLETYTHDYMPKALDRVLELSGASGVTLLGYCFGGVLALLATGASLGSRVANLVTAATPVDWSVVGAIAAIFDMDRVDPEEVVDETGNVPAEVILDGFRVLKPTARWVNYANLWENLWNDKYVEGYQAIGRWSFDHIPFPGACFRQLVYALGRDNGIMQGTLQLDGRSVDLSCVDVPVLNVVAEQDHLVPADAARPLLGLVGSSEVEELALDGGHMALVMGRQAATVTMPKVGEWLGRHS